MKYKYRCSKAGTDKCPLGKKCDIYESKYSWRGEYPSCTINEYGTSIPIKCVPELIDISNDRPKGISGLERLSIDFNKGYTKGIQSVIEVFQYIQSDLAHHHKRLTSKMVTELLDCCLENRERLRESNRGFIRWNGIKNRFEFYEPKGD